MPVLVMKVIELRNRLFVESFSGYGLTWEQLFPLIVLKQVHKGLFNNCVTLRGWVYLIRSVHSNVFSYANAYN